MNVGGKVNYKCAIGTVKVPEPSLGNVQEKDTRCPEQMTQQVQREGGPGIAYSSAKCWSFEESGTDRQTDRIGWASYLGYMHAYIMHAGSLMS